jgi:hypothetical protein
VTQGKNLADAAKKPRVGHFVYSSVGGAERHDIRGFVAVAFERSKEFIGMELKIAGSEFTNPQAAEVFSRVLGRSVEFVPMPIPAEKVYSQMFNCFNDAGFQANIAHLRNQYPEVRLQTLEEWLYNEGWHKRVRRIATSGTTFSLQGAP